MGTARHFATNSVYKISANIAMRFTGVILSIYLAYALNPTDFGIYMWAIGLVPLLEVFSNIGTGAALTRFIPHELAKEAREEAAARFQLLFKLRLVAILASSAALFLLADAIATSVFSKPFLGEPLRFTAIIVLAYGVFSFLDSAFLALVEMKQFFHCILAQSAARIILTALLVYVTGSYYGALWGYLLSIVLSVGFLIAVLKAKYGFLLGKCTVEKDSRRMNSYLLFAYIGILGFTGLMSVDLVVSSALLPIEEVGFYRVAFSWANAFSGFIPVYLMAPFFSRFSTEGSASLQRGFRMFFRFVVAAALPTAILVAVFSQQIIGAMYPAALAASASPLLSVLASIIVSSSLVVLFMHLFVGVELPKVHSSIFLLCIPLAIVLNLVLIPRFGIMGVALATSGVYLVAMAMMAIMASMVAGIRFCARDIACPIGAAVPMAAIVWLMPPAANLLIAIAYSAIALAVYGAVMFAIRGFEKSELRLLVRWILKRS